jgi:protein involved in polysaccharide export with SLBB domain
VSLPKHKSFIECVSKIQTIFVLLLTILLPVCLTGCGDQVHLPSARELIEFENAGPLPPSVDMNRVVRAKIGGGPYRVVIGDALELTMPAVVRFITTEESVIDRTVMPYISRVNASGNIVLPIVGDIVAAGRTLSQIESDIIDAYYPKHVVTRPSVFASVIDYKTTRVSITGAVLTPGIYSLRSDQMSLVALLMEAGGIIEQGAALIRIVHSDQDILNNEEAEVKAVAQSFEGVDSAKSNLINAAKVSVPNKTLRIQRIAETSKFRESESLVLPIKGFNILFADVALQDGDSVIVERLQQPLFTVMELVNSPGNFPYPPDVQYTLMQAIGFAGGLNLIAEPRYATIYRLKRDSTIVSATFPIKGKSKLANALNTLIKPGDIIAVEHTPRTRTAIFLDRAFRVSLGTYWGLDAEDF